MAYKEDQEALRRYYGANSLLAPPAPVSKRGSRGPGGIGREKQVNANVAAGVSMDGRAIGPEAAKVTGAMSRGPGGINANRSAVQPSESESYGPVASTPKAGLSRLSTPAPVSAKPAYVYGGADSSMQAGGGANPNTIAMRGNVASVPVVAAAPVVAEAKPVDQKQAPARPARGSMAEFLLNQRAANADLQRRTLLSSARQGINVESAARTAGLTSEAINPLTGTNEYQAAAAAGVPYQQQSDFNRPRSLQQAAQDRAAGLLQEGVRSQREKEAQDVANQQALNLQEKISAGPAEVAKINAAGGVDVAKITSEAQLQTALATIKSQDEREELKRQWEAKQKSYDRFAAQKNAEIAAGGKTAAAEMTAERGSVANELKLLQILEKAKADAEKNKTTLGAEDLATLNDLKLRLKNRTTATPSA